MTRERVLVWVIILLSSLSQTTEAMYASAIPNISSYFNTGGNIVQLSFTVYYLGFSLGIFLLGRVSDLYGRKPVVIFGLVLFSITCFCSSHATCLETIMILRFFQAFGASIGSVVGQAISRDSFQGSELSKLYTTVAIFNAILPSIGATSGGYIVQYFSWHSVFNCSSIITMFILIFMYQYLPETNAHIGVARNNKYTKIIKIVIKDKVVLLNAYIIGALNGILFGFYAEAPFIFIQNIGMAPSEYGRCIFLLAFAGIIGSVACKILIKKQIISSFRIVTLGLFLSLIGCALLTISTEFLNSLYIDNKILAVTLIFIPMMIQLLGHSMAIPMVLRHALEDYSKVTGTAGSVFGSLYYLLIAIISIMVSNCHSYGSALVMKLFLILSILANIAFYFVIKLHPFKKSHGFE